MTRRELKVLIKECLVEILAEGLGQGLSESVQARPRMQQPVAQPQRRSPLNNVVYSQPVQHRQVQQQVINQVTKDPIMASIFADTMNNTLVEQSQAERRPGQQPSTAGGDQASRVMHNVDPVDVFGDEAAARWAEAAFAPSRGRSMMSSVTNDFAAEMMAMNQGLKKT